MNKKNKGKAILTILMIMSLLGTYGCSKVDLSDEDKDKVVEYAVNAVINHDKNNIVKIPKRTTQNSDENSTTPSQKEEDTTKNPDGNVQAKNVTMNEALNLDGFSVDYTGYTVNKKYPDSNEGFSMVATSQNVLLILKFNVTNNSASEANLNLSKMYNYRCTVNGSSKVNVQITGLINALNTWNGNLAGGETKEMVLVFQISEEISDNINKINLSVVKDKETKTVTIKE